MAGAPEQEPSIEEILASIRQIISDDDDHPEPAASADPEPVPAPEPVAPPPPPPPPPPKEDVLELKDPLPPPERPVIDLEEHVEEEVTRAPAVDLTAPEPEPVRAAAIDLTAPAAPTPEPSSMESVLTDAASAAALSGFAKLNSGMHMDRGNTPHVADGSTLEDIVRDMLNPMLRTWLDANLPGIIEKLVQKELDKLARKAMDD
jgi:cell pole-organizing protein PopZ